VPLLPRPTACRPSAALGLVLALGTLAAACGDGSAADRLPGRPTAAAPVTPPPATASPSPEPPPAWLQGLLPGMPPPLQEDDVYAATRQGLAPAVRDFPELIYVPNGKAGTVSVVDPVQERVIDTFPAGRIPQHVVPSYDLTTLWVNSSGSNTLTEMDPATGQVVRTLTIDDPYNLYFTPDGGSAIVVAERLRRLDFRDPQTMELQSSLDVPCAGVNHLDFSFDGRFFVASCEFSAELLKIDTQTRTLERTLQLPGDSKPQDVKVSPDGNVFYVADLNRGGLWTVDGAALETTGFIPTGAGAHGLYTSRDSRSLYVTNRTAGTVSVLDLATQQVLGHWRLPPGASPDMGNLSSDGDTLWLTSRYGNEIYAVDVHTGETTATVEVGAGPHGLTVYPQPGRYSLGHTGILR
jgi:YVTN family beta-propeller protein